ncbi:unnamed protein product [Euphydryas editha]|uniref:Uncharacterized protein n=1 Tax=Euphydryas editha TaxID=104508 RepID=A0AAU9TWT1_EUPED|nr:unnamed protein product [Euphydryas editha]
MSVQRSPPQSLSQGPTKSSGSHPDLSKLGSLTVEPKVTLRKRKQPLEQDCECRTEIQEMRLELNRIGTLLEKYVTSNEQILKEMQKNIAEVKNEITELKSFNEQTWHLIRDNTTKINNIQSTTVSVEAEQKILKNTITKIQDQMNTDEAKINFLESKIETLKLQEPNPLKKNHENEKLIHEIQERAFREKNVIFVGLPEQCMTTAKERASKDESDILKITSQVATELPKPTKVTRIGKYIPGKNRRVKVCYDAPYPAKCLLRNKDKLPEHIKIFSDQTPTQQKYLKSLKEELEERKKKERVILRLNI